MSDPAKYRTKDEVDNIRQNHDPIESAKQILIERQVSEDEFKKLDKEIKQIIQEAVDFSENSSEPDAAELYTDILIETA